MTLRAKELKLKISNDEIANIVRSLPIDMHGRVTVTMYESWLKNQTQPSIERLAILNSLMENHQRTPIYKAQTIVDYVGTSMYAALATICAGEAGMNVVGSTLVGCVTGLGGGTLNNVMMGNTPVGWMTDTKWLSICIASCVTTFYCWPIFEDKMAQREFLSMTPDANGHVHLTGFAAWLSEDGEFAQRLKMRCVRINARLNRYATGEVRRVPFPVEVFDSVDDNHNGFLTLDALRLHLRRASFDSPMLYVVDSICLASFSVSGAMLGIARGMHPLICAVTGVTICFGGLMRDLLTKRDVALGADSFAFATGCGAATYVGLRELYLRGWPLSLTFRTGATVATVLTLRWLAWRQRPEPFLFPMFEVPPLQRWIKISDGQVSK
jgi:uncharacterized membrane protein YeiH